MTYSNASRYEGVFGKGKFEGIGKMIYANGDTYLGDWKASKKHGKGEYVNYRKS